MNEADAVEGHAGGQFRVGNGTDLTGVITAASQCSH